MSSAEKALLDFNHQFLYRLIAGLLLSSITRLIRFKRTLNFNHTNNKKERRKGEKKPHSLFPHQT